MNAPSKETIAEIFETIARLLELKGENPFKVRAYTNAARAVETAPDDLSKLVAEDRLGELEGVGKALADKITELVQTGELQFFNKLKAEFPAGLFEIFELQGLGPKKIKAVYEQLGVTSLAELEAASKDGRVAALAGFGAKSATNILKAIEERKKHAGIFRLGDVAAEAERMLEDLKAHEAVLRAANCGSYRRRKETVRDLDFLVATNEPAAISHFFVHHPMVIDVIVHGPTKSSVRLKSGIQADLRVVTNEQFAFALNYFTGSKEHNIVMRGRALQRGWTLNEYRLGPLEKSKIEPQPIPPIYEERDLYAALGLDYIEPELREDHGEFAAAETHTLPRLIELDSLCGTFHCHTTASDGSNSLAEMACAARDLGLDYLGIADHSKSSFQARGLSAEQLRAQGVEIDRMNAEFGGDFRLFKGVECDILKDGSLDFPDDVLAELDYVVASVHAVFNLPEAEMTARIIRAISNPHVTMLGHVTGRLLLAREPYAVNLPAVIEAAAATGTWIELNASPRRLELDWRWWKLAKEKGVKCVINPDAHSTAGFQNLWFGIGAARKGWLERADVMNCLPLEKIEPALQAKRARV